MTTRNSILSFFIVISLNVMAQESPNEVSPEFKKSYDQAAKGQYFAKAEEMLLNTDPEPDLSTGFVSLYNGKDLEGWVRNGSNCKFEAVGEMIVGTYVPPEGNSFLCTVRDDYTDFVFTAELKWVKDGNTGVQFRSKLKDKKGVFGPQFEMEEASRHRNWSGGIFAQGIGEYFYPLWLNAHEKARKAVNYNDWNRITIYAKGETVKTWLNGVPASHWQTKEFMGGFFGLQIHKNEKTEPSVINFRNIKIKEL